MIRKIISAKLDVIFKKMFSTKENEELLRDFLSSLLEIPYDSIQEIEVLNPEVQPDRIDEKFSRMDIKLRVNNRIIIVEMQISRQSDYGDRTVYYWAKEYSGELKSGEKYEQLKPCIAINILNFNMFKCENFHSHFVIMEKDRHEILTDKCAIHFFELKKINKKVNKDNRMELWLQLINAESEEELEMLQQTNVPVIKKAVMVIRHMSEDEKMRELAYQREKALHDEASALGNARREGIAEGLAKGRAEGEARGRAEGRAEGEAKGRAEGRAEGEAKGRAEGEAKGRAEIIAKMKASGMTDEQIADIVN